MKQVSVRNRRRLLDDVFRRYHAEVSDAGRVSAAGGLRDEREDIPVVSLAIEAARAALAGGRLVDAKTIVGLQWLCAPARP